MKQIVIIKLTHTIIWLFFNAVIFYLLYAVLANKIDHFVWIGLFLFFIEGIVLVVFKNMCPLTILAKNYSTSTKHNFDIYLPEWLAKYNKLIYSLILLVVVIVLIYRLITNNQTTYTTVRLQERLLY